MSFVAEVPCWTWREAIEVANRAYPHACDRVSVRRTGDRWVVTYQSKPIVINAAG
jgi:hypothetical protein